MLFTAADKAVAACCGGNVHALTVLLDSGVSVDHITGESQSTLLHMAAYCGQVGGCSYNHMIKSAPPLYAATSSSIPTIKGS